MRAKVNPAFNKLMEHVGHNVHVTFYGREGRRKNAVNASIECEDCDVVLLSEDKYEEEEKGS